MGYKPKPNYGNNNQNRYYTQTPSYSNNKQYQYTPTSSYNNYNRFPYGSTGRGSGYSGCSNSNDYTYYDAYGNPVSNSNSGGSCSHGPTQIYINDDYSNNNNNY